MRTERCRAAVAALCLLPRHVQIGYADCCYCHPGHGRAVHRLPVAAPRRVEAHPPDASLACTCIARPHVSVRIGLSSHHVDIPLNDIGADG